MAKRITPELHVTPLESGVCCASMLLHAHGYQEPTAALREELDLGRGGSTLPQLASLFTARGVPAEPRQLTVAEASELSDPFIAVWANSTFVIVERVAEKSVILVDPAIGRRKAPIEELKENFGGWVLVPDFAAAEPWEAPKPGPRPTPFKDALLAAKRPLGLVALMSLVVYATDIAVPYLTQFIIDRTVVQGDGDLMHQFLWPCLGIGAAVLLGTFLRSFFIATSAVRIGRDTSESVLLHLLRLPFRYFDSRQPGELAYRLAGIGAIRDSLSEQLFTGFFHVGGLVVYLAFMFSKSAWLGATCLFFVVAMLGVLFGSRHLFYSAIQNELSQTGRMQTEQLEAVQSILTVKTRPHLDQFLTKWRAQNEVSLAYLRRRMLLQGGVNAIIGVLQFAGPTVTLLVGIWLWRGDHVSLGEVFGALAVSSLIFVSANAIYGSVALYLICRTFARRLEDITRSVPASVGTVTGESLGRLDVHDASYRYTKDSPDVLKGVSMRVEPGQTVAIVGPTGSGKSTLAKLMLGLYEPSEGSIRYGNHPVGELAPSFLFDRLAFVPQDVLLETATLFDNVALGRDVTADQVEQACRLACVHDDIMTFSSGYQTMVNNLGANLSGGQRQRIAIARAVLSKPEILVLDEATSSLDNATETVITDNLRALGCAIVVIAHRLASVVDADVTYVLRHGEIVDTGRHDELIDRVGVYQSLFAGQAQLAA